MNEKKGFGAAEKGDHGKGTPKGSGVPQKRFPVKSEVLCQGHPRSEK